uniref:RHS repeat domain-containing protein n=1 Tax=Paenibacillus fonticola TaxID=379896 RepID=UPI00035E9A5E
SEPASIESVFSRLTNSDKSGQEPDPASLITWVFEDGTFHPAAKITSEGHYSIVTDHLGTPVEMYDEHGERVWSCELDIYGNVRKFILKGDHNACPFRYPGQYEDVETGLYYNRFRYYSPHEGMYTQQDPIGLAGGIRLYGYVDDPIIWVDVFGLKKNGGSSSENSTHCGGGGQGNARNSPGVATSSKASDTNKMMRGTDGNAGVVPKDVADKLNGKQFNNFDEFRREFWKAVSNSKYSKEFSSANIKRIQQGYAPIATKSQQYGGHKSYILHHKTPIQHGGGVYNVDNILIVSPRLHQEILNKSYHFGR